MNTFPKIEKLCGQIRINNLYATGKKFTCWPLRVTYQQTIGKETKSQVLIWAAKSLFKHAVDRNHLRRLIREAYRLNNKSIKDMHLQIAFNYIDKAIQPYATIEKAMIKAIAKIAEDTSTDQNK